MRPQLLIHCALSVQLLAGGCTALGELECPASDPACNTSLFALQFLIPRATTPVTTSTVRQPTHLYAVGGGLRAWTIDATTGDLGSTLGPFGAGNNPVDLTVNASSTYLYTTSPTPPGDGIYAFQISNGTPANSVIYQGGTAIARVALSSDQRFLYAPTGPLTALRGFTVDSDTGALSQVAGSPFAASCVSALVVDPQNRYLYAGDVFVANAQAFPINTTSGALSAAINRPAVAAHQLAVTSTGERVYVAARAAGALNLYGFTVDSSTGTWTAVPGSPYTFTGGVVSARGLAVDANDRYVYAIDTTSNTIRGYAISTTDGSLTSTPGSPYGAGNSPQVVAISPDAQFVYVSADNSANQAIIRSYRINSDGSLTAAATFLTGGPATTVPTALGFRSVTVTR